ncbi:MAG: branched-chain amino acid ABC transporter permease [Acidimicrobiales bacterium]
MGVYIAAIGFGLVAAAVLAIAAVGFTMQFAVTDVLNLAYGGVMIAAAYITYAVNRLGVTVWLGVVAGAVAGAGLSVLLNRVVYTPFQRRKISSIGIVIVSLGMALVFEYVVQAVAGPTNVSYTMSQGPTLRLGSFQLTTVQLVIIALSILTMIVIHFLLQYTRLGKAMRATAANRSLARNCGIRTDRVVTLTWLITGALCGVSGSVFAMNSGSFGATSTDLFLVIILAAVFLGGIGQPYGAMLGALVIGLITEVSAALITPSYKDVIAFVILVVMMASRPRGLFGAELST